MSGTDELRRMLDERGVEWRDTKIGKGFITVYEHDCITWIVTEHSSGRLSVKGCVKPTQGHYDGMTPEQAIAATLGSCNCSNNCTNGERTRACLPHFWTHDGTLHIEATRMPTRIVVCEGGTCEFVPKRELDASEAENAKLRELVDGWDFCSKTKSSTFDNCVGCPLFIQTLHSYRCARDERMRELGIEVGE